MAAFQLQSIPSSTSCFDGHQLRSCIRNFFCPVDSTYLLIFKVVSVYGVLQEQSFWQDNQMGNWFQTRASAEIFPEGGKRSFSANRLSFADFSPAHSYVYCMMHRSVTFDLLFALGIKPSDITFFHAWLPKSTKCLAYFSLLYGNWANPMKH